MAMLSKSSENVKYLDICIDKFLFCENIVKNHTKR